MSLNGRSVLISGANRGIGRAMALQFAEIQARVLVGSRNLPDGVAVASELTKQGYDAIAVELDVADDESVAKLSRNLEQRAIAVDVLVNNAGVFFDKDAATLDLGWEAFEKTLKVNLAGAIRLCRAFIPGMIKRHWGRVINVSSQLGQLASPGGQWATYRLSKTALNAYTKILAEEVREHGVLVNTMCPGWCRTRMGGENAPLTAEDGARTAIFLAELPDKGPTGKFWESCKEIQW